MKALKIIIIAIIAATISACDEKNVFPDPMTIPVKALNLNVEITDIYAMPDGRAAALVKTTYDNENESYCEIAIIDKNCNYTLSGRLDTYNSCKLDDLYESSSGNYYAKLTSNDADIYYLKLNNKGLPLNVHKGGSNIINSYNLENNCFDYKLCAMMDNGEIAEINTIVTGDDDGVNSKCKLRYVHYVDYDLSPEYYNAFEYDIETADGFFATNAVSFENKIILYNEFNDITSKDGEYKAIEYDNGGLGYGYVPYATIHNEFNEYYILNTDGSIVKSGKCDFPIQYIRYVDGYIYIITSDISLTDESDDQYIYKWQIIKIDISGNEIYTSDPINTFYLSGNITIDNGTLIITGAIITDYENEEGYGAIFLLDDNNGTFKEDIELNYDDVIVIPSVISPNQNGEYDVFAIVRHSYDNWNDFMNGDSEMSAGRVYIYHTDDLHKLQIND